MAVSDILRYLGSPGCEDARLLRLIGEGREMLRGHMRPLHTLLRCPLRMEGSRICAGALTIRSEALAKCLRCCDGAFLFAATLGAGVDRCITRQESVDMSMALVLQACAVDAIESYCDAVCETLRRGCEAEGLGLRPRFSPGYGDFSIKHQQDILNILDAGRRIGLFATGAHMLTPLKSVTALIGIGPAGDIGKE